MGRQLMIWKCRNAIQSFWHHKPLPYIGKRYIRQNIFVVLKISFRK